MRLTRIVPLLLACSPVVLYAGVPAARGEIAGVYEIGFERQTFRPCGSGETWWVGTAPTSLHRGLGTRAYVRVKASVGPRGAFGHLGKYPRQIVIREVVAEKSGAECPSVR